MAILPETTKSMR